MKITHLIDNVQRNKYKITHTHSTKNIDIHIFLLCKNYKKDLAKIATHFQISKFPAKLFDDFHGAIGEMVSYYLEDTKVLFVGYGKEGECNSEHFYELSLQLGKLFSTKEYNDKNIMFHLVDSLNEYHIHHQVSGFITGNYLFDLLKSSKKNKSGKSGTFYFYTSKRKIKGLIEKYIELSLIQNEVRNYMNLPSNLLRIKEYISYLKNAMPKNVSVKVIHKKKLIQMHMNLILAVNQGSNQDCALLQLEYKGKSKDKGSQGKSKPICFIGKGVMFDSGGYNLKIRGMEDMKFDMSASSIVYGIIKAHAILQSPGHYIALLPLVENMIGKDAIRPSDVVISHSGKSVEITNTDAEGRLIIADCLSYCAKFHPKLIIDIGTLAGDTAYIFANKSSVIMGNHFQYNRQIIEIGKKYHENIWELPMWAEYLDDLKSDIADIRNSGRSNKAGAILVGTFLSQFVPKDVAWVHLDIAGTEIAIGSPYYHNGAKVETLKTLYTFTKGL